MTNYCPLNQSEDEKMHSNGLLTRKAQSDSFMEYTNICSENELPDGYNSKPNLIEPSKPRGLPNLNTSSSRLSCEDKARCSPARISEH